MLGGGYAAMDAPAASFDGATAPAAFDSVATEVPEPDASSVGDDASSVGARRSDLA